MPVGVPLFRPAAAGSAATARELPQALGSVASDSDEPAPPAGSLGCIFQVRGQRGGLMRN